MANDTKVMPKLTLADAKRFWSKVDFTGDGCWEWGGCLGTHGYGVLSRNGVQYQAHRFSYSLAYGDPRSLLVLHKCDNPRCVRPDHLFTGTTVDNMADRNKKGRQARGERSGSAKLTATKVAEIRSSNESNHAIARRFGLGVTTVRLARIGRNWRHVLNGGGDRRTA